MFSIGEFSKITGLSVKTIRFYHEKGLLIPSYVDFETGYRYFTRANAERAWVISGLRRMEFSLNEILGILESCEDESDVVEHLERQKRVIAAKIRQHKNTLASIEQIISREKEVTMKMQQSEFNVEEKVLDTMLIAGYRMKGRYDEIGKGFSKLGKSFGRYACGEAMCLYYDGEHRDDGANFEPCFPIKKGTTTKDISVRELPGGKCVSLIHKGPYDELGRSYAKLMAYVKDNDLKTRLPSREVYLKGPGMLFKGNPKNYLTELQLLIESPSS